MKTMKYILALSILLSGYTMTAQKLTANPEYSTIEWEGKKIGGKHQGTVGLKSGSFELHNNKIISGTFVIDMTSIKNQDVEDETYKKKLEGHLKSDDFFGVEKFPTAILTVKESSEFKNGVATVSGDITIKGKTEFVTFDFVKESNKFITKLEIDRSKFDVRYGSNSFFDNLGDKAINDIFTLDISLSVN